MFGKICVNFKKVLSQKFFQRDFNMKITHIIFDMDGVILDTESVYTQIFNDLLSEWNFTYPYDMKRKMMGMKMSEGMKYLVNEFKLPISPEELELKHKAQFHHEVWNNIEIIPGIKDFVTYLQNKSIPIAIATGSSKQNFDLKTKNYKSLISKFHHVVVGDDAEVKKGKPDPEVYNIALKRFDDPLPQPGECLVIEDSINGVLSGCLAGMRVLWIPDIREPKVLPEVLKPFADKIVRLDSITEFNPSKYGLPCRKYNGEIKLDDF